MAQASANSADSTGPVADDPPQSTGASSPGVADLVIPARNEADNLDFLLPRLPRGVFRHVVVCDNGSTDGTADVAARHGAVVVGESAPGYGSACLRALAWIAARRESPAAVAFVDADGSDDLADLPGLVEPILAGRADLVIADRTASPEPGALTPVQRFGNALACGLMRWGTGVAYRDLGPMRAVGWEALVGLAMEDRTWGWTVEMQFKAAARGLRVEQRPTRYGRRRGGTSKISGTVVGSCRAGWKILATIARLSWREARYPPTSGVR